MLIINLVLVHAQVIHNFKNTKLCIQDRGVADSSHTYLRSLAAREVFVMDTIITWCNSSKKGLKKKSQIHAKPIKASYQQPTYMPAAAIFKAVEEEGKTGLTLPVLRLWFRSSYLV